MSDHRALVFPVGERFEGTLVDDLQRAHIAQYAGASGDFNSVHVDETYALSEAGRDSVIAHGMFTMGLTSTFIASIVGNESLRTFGGRFLAAVRPGDTLVCTLTVSAADTDAAGTQHLTLDVETRTTDDVVVFHGYASVVVALPH